MIVPVFNYHSSIITIMGKSKRLAMLPLLFKQEYLALSSKKKMKSRNSFSRTVEAYTRHICMKIALITTVFKPLP